MSTTNLDYIYGALKIFSENKCSFLRDYNNAVNVFVSLPELSRIDYNGFGNIYSMNTINAQELIVSADQG